MSRPKPRILVVGAGPTGLALACFLANQDIPVDVVDRAHGPSEGARALGVQARTLELLHGLGVSAQLVQRGVELTGIEARAHDQIIWTADLAETNKSQTRYPNALALPQAFAEQILTRRFAELGGEVRWHTALAALDESRDGVRVELTSRDRSTPHHYKWVVGCDGAQSHVRQLLGVDFPVQPGKESWWLVVDARCSQPEADLPQMTLYFNARLPIAILPLPQTGHCRLLIPRVAELQDHPDEPTMPLAAVRRILSERYGDSFSIDEILWQKAFAIRSRLAEHYRRGRIFLAGDAAHLHSPIGGQGMNTGIQDAANLAWKLGLVTRGAADQTILDTYEEERRPVAQELLQATDRATSFMSSRRGFFTGMRRILTNLALNSGRVRADFARRIAMLDVSYRTRNNPILDEERSNPLEPLVNPNDEREQPRLGHWRDFNHGPQPGGRAVDVDLGDTRLYDYMHVDRATLFLFDGEETTVPGYRNLKAIARDCSRAIPGFLDPVIVVRGDTIPPSLRHFTHAQIILDADGHIHRAYHARCECLYLVRPDLYVGFRSQPADKQSLLAHINALTHPEPLAS